MKHLQKLAQSSRTPALPAPPRFPRLYLLAYDLSWNLGRWIFWLRGVRELAPVVLASARMRLRIGRNFAALLVLNLAAAGLNALRRKRKGAR